MNCLRLSSLMFAVAVLSACGAGEATIDAEDGDASDLESALSLTRGRFETFVARDGKHYFHLLAGNGEKVLASQAYASLDAAGAGIASVKVNGADEQRYLLREAADGAWYFVLTAANGAIIGVSEMYATQANATRGMSTVAQVVRNTVAQDAAQPGATRFQVFRGLDQKYYFHLRAGNGEIVLQSQGYSSRAGANGGVSSVQQNGADARRYQVLPAADGKFYFVLRAANGQIIGRGQTYATKASAERGVAGCVELLAAKAS